MATNVNADTIQANERIAVAAGAALLLAATILLTVVLPAEYGLDPFGTGGALGLTALAQAKSASESPAPTTTQPTASGTAAVPAVYKVDATTFRIGPYEGFEYKYRIEKGGGMVYSWQSNGKVRYEFHGQRDGAGPDEFESYEKQENDHASGTLAASFSGIHGWFWENRGPNELTITLTSAGFYSSAQEFREKQQIVHTLADAPQVVQQPQR